VQVVADWQMVAAMRKAVQVGETVNSVVKTFVWHSPDKHVRT
jgi:hypothetical protein